MSCSPDNVYITADNYPSPVIYPTSSPVPTNPVPPIVLPTITRNERRVEEVLPFRIAVASIWILLFSLVLPNSAILQGITIFTVCALNCVGLLVICALIAVPIVYAINPDSVIHFTFGSFAPTAAVWLHHLDHIKDHIVDYAKNRIFN